MKKGRIAAIIPAAGSGERLGLAESKPFLRLGDKPILVHSLQKFQDLPEIDEIFLLVRAVDLDRAKQLVSAFGLTKVGGITEGGELRQETVSRGLQRIIGRGVGYVLVHDAVRPFITAEKTREVLDACKQHDAAVVAVQLKDTIKQTNSTPFVQETLDRSKLWAVQTPQAFRFDLLLEAHKCATEEHYIGTDDASLVERLGVKVKIVEGSYDNIKITTPEDLELAELILRRQRTHVR